jgi:hypothetical protein
VHPSCLFYVTDSSFNGRYLLVTGSAFFIMPWQSDKPPSEFGLSSVDGRLISCWGQQPFTVTIDGVPRQWTFLLAAISFPILGADFLRQHGLLLDVANVRLLSGPSSVNSVIAGIATDRFYASRCSYADMLRSSSPASSLDPSVPSFGPSPPSLGPSLSSLGLSSPSVATSAPSMVFSFPSSLGSWLADLQHEFPAVFLASLFTATFMPPMESSI